MISSGEDTLANAFIAPVISKDKSPARSCAKALSQCALRSENLVLNQERTDAVWRLTNSRGRLADRSNFFLGFFGTH